MSAVGPGGATGPAGSLAVYDYMASEAESTTTSLTFVQKLRLTTSSLAAGDYRIGYSMEITNSNKKQRTEVRVQVDDTTTIAEGVNAALNQHDDYVMVSGFAVVTLTAGTHNIDIDYRALSNTAKIRRARLELFEAP